MKNLIEHIRESLSLKLSLWLLFFTVTVFVVSMSFLYLYSRDIMHQEAKERAFLTLEHSSLKLAHLITEIETATSNAEWLVETHTQPDSLLAFTRRVTELNPNIHSCSITTEPFFFPQYGRYFSAYSMRVGDSIETIREAEYEYYEKVWYNTPKKLGTSCWVDPFDDYNAGTLSSTDMIASYCMPLYDEQHQFYGVISTDVTLTKLAETITMQKPFANSYFMLLGQDGHFFIHPDSTKLIKESIFSIAEEEGQPELIVLGHEMQQQKKHAMEVKFDGKSCLVFYQPVPQTPWSIALVCPLSDIFSGLNKLFYLVVLLTIGGLIVLLFFCRHIVSLMIAPLNRLAKLSLNFANGQFEEHVPHSHREDIIGRLQNSFATMQQSLATHINHIKDVNAQMEQRNKELLQANQMAEKSQRKKNAFVQNMTHQIRTPLNIVLGFAQVMSDNYHAIEAEELKSLNNMVEHNTVLVNRMALMLADSALLDQVTPYPLEDIVSCNDVARETIDFAHHQYPYMNFRLESSLPDTLCIRTNHLFLIRSIRELLINAAKYSNSERVRLKVENSTSRIYYTIEDVGPGIAEEVRDRMFDPFVKVDDFTEGLGLGLPLTKQHVMRLGGELTFDTSYKKGCRFIIDIPRLN